MSDRMKKILKFFGLGIVWVYILSIRVDGYTLFFHANNFFVRNQVIEAVDQQLTDIVHMAATSAGSLFNEISGKTKRL